MAADKIPLPPINIGTAVIQSTAGLRLVADIDIRARDQEIVRAVLEAAASECRAIELAAWREYKIGRRTSAHTEGRSDGAGECAAVIKALEFHHE